MPAPTLYYLRHGETVWNAEGRRQGHRVADLPGRGRARADPCGALLHRLATRGALMTLRHSTMSPARSAVPAPRWSTCAACSGSTPPATAPMGGWAEMSFGDWEGLRR